MVVVMVLGLVMMVVVMMELMVLGLVMVGRWWQFFCGVRTL